MPRRHGRLAPTLTYGRPKGSVNIGDITESRRRGIYVALAEATRAGLDIDDARYSVARKFVLTIVKVEAVQKEGFDRGWPVA
jgi:hypothetical protein